MRFAIFSWLSVMSLCASPRGNESHATKEAWAKDVGNTKNEDEDKDEDEDHDEDPSGGKAQAQAKPYVDYK